MNASLAYLSTQHSHLVHLGAADDDDDGLDVDEMVVGARLDAAGEHALLMGAHLGAAVDGMAWHGHWGAVSGADEGGVDEGEGGEYGGECSEGWQEEEMGWVECTGSAAGDASSLCERYSGPLTHAALAAAGVITSTAAAAAAASPSGAPSSFHSSPNRAAPLSASSHGSTPAAISPACLSPRVHPSAHSPCRSSPHSSPSATLPRVPCSLSHGPCDSSAGSGAGEGRRRSMLGMSRSMGVATLSHALSSLTHSHAAALSSGSVSGSPAAARPASRLMLSSGPTPDTQHTYGNGSTSLGSGTGASRGMGAEVEDTGVEGDMGLDIDILLSDLRSRQLRSSSGPLAPRMSGPLRSVTHPAAGMAAAAAAAVASVGERGGEDRGAQLCDVGVDAWRSAAEADSGDHSLAACS
ncbi:unnamed protein product [Closterium sp. Yama58-4]|nr:unnamed protein product [Closterium sp. Yama58-4]